MFGGLIAHAGRVVEFERDPRGGVRLGIEAPAAIAEGVAAKDSIAIDGVCLTVVEHDALVVRFDVVPETLARSTLGGLHVGGRVNLELSLRLGERLGGHFVYGHVDATALIVAKVAEGQGHRLSLDLPAALERFIVEKGYVALDGKGPGDLVNLEIDPVARYALGAAASYSRGSDVSSDELAWAYEI